MLKSMSIAKILDWSYQNLVKFNVGETNHLTIEKILQFSIKMKELHFLDSLLRQKPGPPHSN